MLCPATIEAAARAIVGAARTRATPDASARGLLAAMEAGRAPAWAAEAEPVRRCNPGELASALYRAAARVH